MMNCEHVRQGAAVLRFYPTIWIFVSGLHMPMLQLMMSCTMILQYFLVFLDIYHFAQSISRSVIASLSRTLLALYVRMK